MMGTLLIWSVAVFPSGLNVSPLDGTGVTQYRPSAEMGGWKSCIWFAGTAGPRKIVSHVCANMA